MYKVRAKFITPNYIKQNTVIDFNVDDSKIVPVIYQTQDTILQTALGTNFYEHLKNGISANTLTIHEEELIENYIQPLLSEAVVYKLLPFIFVNITNKGPQSERSANSDASTLEDVKYLRNVVRDSYEYYLNNLNTYLCDYSTLFPEYNESLPKENVKPDKKSYFGGIYIPHNKCHNC